MLATGTRQSSTAKSSTKKTQATASQAIAVDGGQYLIVLDREEVAIVCDFIRGHGDSNSFQKRFSNSVSRHFDPKRDLRRVGLANQTTMLMSESLAIAEMFRDAMIERYGDLLIDDHYRAFENYLQRDSGSTGRCTEIT